MVLHFFEGVVLLLSAVEREELLDSRGCILVRLVFIRKETDSAELASDYERVAILREFSIERIVHHVLVDGVDAILLKRLKQLFCFDIPDNQLAAITSGEKDLLNFRMRGEHPRIPLYKTSARARKVFYESLILSVPNFDSTYFLMWVLWQSVRGLLEF